MNPEFAGSSPATPVSQQLTISLEQFYLKLRNEENIKWKQMQNDVGQLFNLTYY